MLLYSTNNKALHSDFRTAIFKGLPDDNGLFMPLEIPALPESFFQNLPNLSFRDIAEQVSLHLLGDVIPENELRALVRNALNFSAPIHQLDENTGILELFHGPSLAFKDFGARYMAALMSYFNQGEQKPLTILVATSGDTGGAVAAGFYKVPGIEVIILYPSGKVSELQEKQLTTLGHNISALEIAGSFDDCQAMVKKAFLDSELTQAFRLSSANSINIARLIPQSFYYFDAYKQLMHQNRPVVFSVPSGNFGNLTAGLFAQRMGLPVHHFIAATNSNDVVPEYLEHGAYHPRPSVRTLSNAMDVGAPSNFARMLDLYGSTWNIMKADISGYAFNDEQTKAAMQDVYQRFEYVIDPHAAVGYLAWKAWQSAHQEANAIGVVLGTAHPAKFLDDVESILGRSIDIPERLAKLKNENKVAHKMAPSFEALKAWLFNRTA